MQLQSNFENAKIITLTEISVRGGWKAAQLYSETLILLLLIGLHSSANFGNLFSCIM